MSTEPDPVREATADSIRIDTMVNLLMKVHRGEIPSTVAALATMAAGYDKAFAELVAQYETPVMLLETTILDDPAFAEVCERFKLRHEGVRAAEAPAHGGEEQ